MNDFTWDGKYSYDFLPSGYFSLVNKSGEHYYEIAVSLIERLSSHLVWIFFWVASIMATHVFFSKKIICVSDKIFASLIIMHLFVFGCRLTTLLLKGGIMPVLFPPLWIRITRRIQKGEGWDLLKKHHLSSHPGLLTNLAIAQSARGEVEDAKVTIRKALTIDPDNPVLFNLFSTLDSYRA